MVQGNKAINYFYTNDETQCSSVWNVYLSPSLTRVPVWSINKHQSASEKWRLTDFPLRKFHTKNSTNILLSVSSDGWKTTHKLYGCIHTDNVQSNKFTVRLFYTTYEGLYRCRMTEQWLNLQRQFESSFQYSSLFFQWYEWGFSDNSFYWFTLQHITFYTFKIKSYYYAQIHCFINL